MGNRKTCLSIKNKTGDKYMKNSEDPNNSETWRYPTQFEQFSVSHMEEILACMEDSDRYICEMSKNRIIKELQYELKRREIS